jgi:hypothetical protein
LSPDSSLVVPPSLRLTLQRLLVGHVDVQAPAPERLIKGGLPTEAMVAHVLVSKYAWHLPLYRQAQMLRSQGIVIERMTLASWVGYAAAELAPVVARLREILLGSVKLAVDETPVPVLDPGRGCTKIGYFWSMARDDRAVGWRRSARSEEYPIPTEPIGPEITDQATRWAHAQATQLTEQLADVDPSQSAELFREMMHFRRLAAEWAHMAAPYVHPRLAAVAHRYTNPDGRPAQPIVNVFIHGNPRPEGAGPLSEPGDNIPDRRYFDDLVGERQKRLPLVRSP